MTLASLGQAAAGGIANGIVYAFLALGFAIVLGLTRALNLAHGELVVLGGYVAYAILRVAPIPPLLVAPVAALAVLPLGLLWRILIARVREPVALNSLVLTFGLSLLLQNAMLGAFSADFRLIVADEAAPHRGPFGLSATRTVAALVGLAAVLGLHLGLVRTRVGMALRATSRDPEAAALMGIDTDRVSTWGFAAAAGLAGAGGVFLGATHYLHPAAGVDLTLLAITLAILADAWTPGRLPGLLAGGIAIGVAESLIAVWPGPSFRELAVALLLLSVLLLRGHPLGSGRGAG